MQTREVHVLQHLSVL